MSKPNPKPEPKFREGDLVRWLLCKGRYGTEVFRVVRAKWDNLGSNPEDIKFTPCWCYELENPSDETFVASIYEWALEDAEPLIAEIRRARERADTEV